MKDELNRLHEKLEKLDDTLNSIDKTLIKQEINLSEHMRRTKLNEESIDVLKDQLVPISKHVHLMSVFGKIFLALAGSSVAAFFIEKLLG